MSLEGLAWQASISPAESGTRHSWCITSPSNSWRMQLPQCPCRQL